MSRLPFVALLAAACITPAPPPMPAPALELAVPFDRAWNAVIDIFASQNLPIATIDKSSGLIVAAPLTVNDADARRWATCQRGVIAGPAASRGEFNVLVRPTAAGSMVRTTARWTYIGDGVQSDCSTTGVWERALQARIQQAVAAP